MKYRRLDNEELEALESEFIAFLTAHTITAEDWEHMKKAEAEKVERLIEKFSDIVFEKVLSKVQILETRTPKDLRFYEFLEDKIKIVGLVIEGETKVTFEGTNDLQQILEDFKKSGAKLKTYTAKRPYKKLKEMEVFALIETQGALIVQDDTLYRSLSEED